MSKLTPDQQEALINILEFIKRPIEEYKDCSGV